MMKIQVDWWTFSVDNVNTLRLWLNHLLFKSFKFLSVAIYSQYS